MERFSKERDFSVWKHRLKIARLDLQDMRSITEFLESVKQNYGGPKGSITNQFTKTQNNFPKHKSISQNTNQFTKTQNNIPKHKSVYQNTNQFLKTQTNFVETQISLPKHKSISQNTNQKTGHLLCYYQRAWKGLIPRIFRVQHGDFKYDKSKMFRAQQWV